MLVCRQGQGTHAIHQHHHLTCRAAGCMSHILFPYRPLHAKDACFYRPYFSTCHMQAGSLTKVCAGLQTGSGHTRHPSTPPLDMQGRRLYVTHLVPLSPVACKGCMLLQTLFLNMSHASRQLDKSMCWSADRVRAHTPSINTTTSHAGPQVV